MNVPVALPVLIGRILVSDLHDASVRTEYVDGTEVSFCPRNHRLNIGFVSYVARDCDPANLIGNRFDRIGLQISTNYPFRAFGRELACECPSNPAPSPGDNSNLSFDLHAYPLPLASRSYHQLPLSHRGRTHRLPGSDAFAGHDNFPSCAT